MKEKLLIKDNIRKDKKMGRGKLKYYVFDECSGNCSDFYNLREEAQKDLDKDITCAWSLNAKVIECMVDDDDDSVLWER